METGHFIQFIIAISFAVIAFMAAYIVPLRVAMAGLMIVAPFELIKSPYGTSTTGLVYLVALSLLLRNGLTRFPLLGAVLGILIAYAISLAMADVRKIDHVFYIIRILPGFMLFYIAYNYVRDSKDVIKFLNILLTINVIIILICILQLIGGSQQVMLFGIKELSLMANRETQGRLNGPFGAEFTSEYLALSSLLLAYLLTNKVLKERWPIWLLLGMLACNLGFLVATGSRGGVVILVAGLLWGAFTFRRELGVRRTFGMLLGGILVASVMATIVIQFTDFNVLLSRVESTEVSDGVLDTRSVTWPTALAAIKERPVVGYGPRLRLKEDLVSPIPGHKTIPYPHSLALFLLYTIGTIGLITYIAFFAMLLMRLYRGSRGRGDRELRGLSMLGFILLTVFLIDEIKIEFLRLIQSGYQSVIFTTLGGFLAFADRARLPSNSSSFEEKSGNDALIVKSSILKEKSPSLLNTVKSKS